MHRFALLAALLVVCVQTLQLPARSQQLSRRGAISAAGAALAVRVLPASAIDDPVQLLSRPDAAKALKEVTTTADALKSFVKNEDAFVKGMVAGDETAVQMPKAISFTTFQALEKAAGPEFMEVAIDYAEASRNARDLVKLAKLTKQKVAASARVGKAASCLAAPSQRGPRARLQALTLPSRAPARPAAPSRGQPGSL
eukprot:Transcript_18210.p1 GENE.Transcript_18210~~Transcript_18210.p1  ORF type:complete len:198 (-),score=55.81 Transcript_18210:243-836(-)